MSSLGTDKQTNINLIKFAAEACYPDNNVLANLTAAQAILESGILNDRGPSQLARIYNNLFGIKGTGTHDPSSILLPTHEYINGKWGSIQAKFAWNDTFEDSIEQHKELLSRLSRYANLQTAQTLDEAAHMIRDDGYATDPNYPSLLIEIYNNHLK